MAKKGLPNGHRLSPELLGRITLARFLRKTPREVERAVRQIESSEHYGGLISDVIPGSRPLVQPSSLEAEVSPELFRDAAPHSAAALIRGRPGPALAYRSSALTRHYLIEEDGVESAIRARAPEDERFAAQLRLIRKMRLVNAGNQMSHAVITAAVRFQRAFLSTLDPLKLHPLRQTELVAGLPPGNDRCRPDPSRASRIIRRTSLLLPCGREMPLRELFPTNKTLLKAHLRQLLWQERKLIARKRLIKPYSDRGLARELSASLGRPCLARTVAYCREDLGVPNWRQRAKQGCYLLTTKDFSGLHRLARPGGHKALPPQPGVYELRLDGSMLDYPMGASPIFYIGSANNLRKRIQAHLCSIARNPCIRARIDSRPVLARFTVLQSAWRAQERRIYHRFVGTFGAPPICNESTP